MPMFCNAMLLLLYVHVCVTRTGWKTRPRPKTVILLIKQSINQSINQDLVAQSQLCINHVQNIERLSRATSRVSRGMNRQLSH